MTSTYLSIYCINNILAADNMNQEAIRNSITSEVGTSMVEKLFPTPEAPKGKGKGQVGHINHKLINRNVILLNKGVDSSNAEAW